MSAMTIVFRVMTRLTNAVYTASGGRLMNKANGGIPVLLITVPGRRSGRLFTNPVGYIVDDGSYVVIGSAGGMPREPQWFRNLRAVDRARVLVGREHRDVSVRITEGEERDRLFATVVADYPGFEGYERKSQGRLMPVAVLTPR